MTGERLPRPCQFDDAIMELTRRPHGGPKTSQSEPIGHVKGAARVLVLATVLVLSGCSRFFFYPSPDIPFTPASVGLNFEDVRIVTSDGVDLAGWYLRAQSGRSATAPAAPHPAVLFLHGNGANMAAHLASVDWLPAAGYGVLVVDYRGYGRSSGSPSIEGVHRDARAALRYLAARPDVDRRRIVVFGQSLGASLAIDVTAELRDEVPVRALIADSAFSDFRDITREKLGSAWLTWPFQWLGALTVPDEPSPVKEIRRLDGMPVLLVAGDADDVVPVGESIRLYHAAPTTTELCVGEGAGHIAVFTDSHWRERLLQWLHARLEMADVPGALRPRAPEIAHDETAAGTTRPARLEPFCERRPTPAPTDSSANSQASTPPRASPSVSANPSATALLSDPRKS
jgi:fermentation-respiration switch protein FrsA (DUF1100 family)